MMLITAIGGLDVNVFKAFSRGFGRYHHNNEGRGHDAYNSVEFH